MQLMQCFSKISIKLNNKYTKIYFLRQQIYVFKKRELPFYEAWPELLQHWSHSTTVFIYCSVSIFQDACEQRALHNMASCLSYQCGCWLQHLFKFLKGQYHEIFNPRFFHLTICPGLLIKGLKPFCIWIRIREEMRNFYMHSVLMTPHARCMLWPRLHDACGVNYTKWIENQWLKNRIRSRIQN
jgi:hypothetical protein